MQMGGVPNIGYDIVANTMDLNCHHVALSRDAAGKIYFYIDGVLKLNLSKKALPKEKIMKAIEVH